MPVFQPTYKDPKTAEQTKVAVWWYDFTFAGKRIRESAKTTLKTLARMAEQKRRRGLEEGFNGLADRRDERIRTIKELADEYLAEYRLRHKAVTFAEYALGNVTRHLGEQMAVEVAEKTVKAYQSGRLKEKAAPKTINEEVGFLLRLLGDQGDAIRARLRRQKALKLTTGKQVGKAYTPEEKERLLATAKAARSPVIYPALMLALHAGMRDAEIRTMQWGRLDLFNPKPYLTVGDSKTEAGEGRTIPLNSELLEAIVEYSKWFTKRFGTIQPDWYVWETMAARPHKARGDAENSLGQRQEKGEGARPLAGQPAHLHYGPSRIGRSGRRNNQGYGRARVPANAEALLAHRHGSQTAGRRIAGFKESGSGNTRCENPGYSRTPCQRFHQSGADQLRAG